MEIATKEIKEELNDIEEELEYLESRTNLLAPILLLLIPASFYVAAVVLIISALGKGGQAAPRAAFGIACAAIGFISMVVVLVKLIGMIRNRQKHKALAQERDRLLANYQFVEEKTTKEETATKSETKETPKSDMDKEREVLLLKLYSEGKISKEEFDEYYKKGK